MLHVHAYTALLHVPLYIHLAPILQGMDQSELDSNPQTPVSTKAELCVCVYGSCTFYAFGDFHVSQLYIGLYHIPAAQQGVLVSCVDHACLEKLSRSIVSLSEDSLHTSCLGRILSSASRGYSARQTRRLPLTPPPSTSLAAVTATLVEG